MVTRSGDAVKPQLGQRVRRTAQHKRIPIGMLGTIDVVHKDGHDFWVCTDEGGFCGWTNFDAWMPITNAEDLPG